MTENKDNKKEEIVPFTQENPEPKKSNFGKYIILASVVLGLGVLGGGYAISNQADSDDSTKESSDTTATESTESTTEVGEVDKSYANQVDADAHKSLESVVVDTTEDPFTDGYKLDNSQLTYLDSKEATELMENGDKFLVYVGRPNCPYCHEYRQVQDPVLKELGEKIYSIDTIYARYDKKLIEIVQDLDIDSVPTVVVIENGKITKDLIEDLGNDYTNYDSLKGWFEENLG